MYFSTAEKLFPAPQPIGPYIDTFNPALNAFGLWAQLWQRTSSEIFGATLSLFAAWSQAHSFADISARLLPTYGFAALDEMMGTAVPINEPVPNFQIAAGISSGKIPPVEVTSEKITPCCRLWNFDRSDLPCHAPTFVIVSPNSGSPAEQMSAAIFAFLPYGNVRLVQAIDPHYVAVENAIDLDSQARAVVIAARLNPNCHMIGDSQSGIPATIATAWMFQNPELLASAPASLSVISSPIDASQKPDASINWMATHTSGEPLYIPVGIAYEGKGRSILPGAVMKLMFKHAPGEPQSPYPPQALSGRFVNDTLANVFRKFLLARGTLTFGGERLDPGAILCPILTFTGANDQICTPPHTHALHGLASGAFKHIKVDVPDAGHYGMISYPTLVRVIAPKLAETIGINSTWVAPSA